VDGRGLVAGHRAIIPSRLVGDHGATNSAAGVTWPTVQRFSFRFDPAYGRAARPFGITPERAWVEVDDEQLIAN
jgi:hypothetical protein